MTIFEAVVIAIVEGLTEFLPVSSTGHMIIAQNVLGVESTTFVKAFTFIIQFGAILSVVVLYRNRFFRLNRTPLAVKPSPRRIPMPAEATLRQRCVGWCVFRAKKLAWTLRPFLHKYDFYWKLFVAFIPAAVLGLLFSDMIDAMLESVTVVAVMLVLGGIFMLFCDRIFTKGSEKTEVTEKRALMVGLFQCISMIPGVSRSMATIVGGMSQRMTRKAAAEFSFFLAVPTMFAATVYKMYKILSEGGMELLSANLPALVIGNVVAFVVAILAIKFFISFVTKYGFKAFGWYRIIVGGILLLMICMGYDLKLM